MNCYDLVPFSKTTFDTIFDLASQRNVQLGNDLGIVICENDEQEDYFRGSTENLVEARLKFLSQVKSRANIDRTFSSFNSESHLSDVKPITYNKKYRQLVNGKINGVIINIPSLYPYSENSVDLITYGPWFTFPHKDELYMGGGTLMPGWNKGVIKIWLFSTSTTRSINQMVMFKTNTAMPIQENRELVARGLIDLHSRNIVYAVAQYPGQVLKFPSGHVHAVITAFCEAETGKKREQQVCRLCTYFLPDNVGLAYRWLQEQRLLEGNEDYVKNVTIVYERLFSPEVRNVYELSIMKSVVKINDSKEAKTVRVNRNVQQMNEGRKRKAVQLI